MEIFNGPKEFFKNWLNVINFSWAIHTPQENVENCIQLILFGGVHIQNPLSRCFTFQFFESF